MKPIRILLVSDTFPPVMGGSEVEGQRISAALIRRGHQVKVLCAGGPPMPPVRNWVDPAGVPVNILTNRSRGRVKDLVFATEVACAIWRDRKKYDIVYFLMQGLHLATGLQAARLADLPMVMKFGGSGVIPLMRRSRVGRFELNWMREWRVRLMVLNDGMTDEALADGFSREQLVWMPNPVDIEEFRPAGPEVSREWRERHGIDPRAPLTVYVGRLSREKGLRELLQGFAAGAAQAPDAVLALVGDGAMRPELEKMTAHLALRPEQVRFIGRVESSEVPYWLRAADLFALLSPSEGFSCALLEAMASGLPSVVTSIPANLQLIEEGVHGLTVPFGDIKAAGEAFRKCFEDEEMRRRMGASARRRAAENYSTERVVERYEALFEDVMARHASVPGSANML